MVYDPSATPVSERIVADIVSTLRAIEPPDFATDLAANAAGRVRLWDGNSFTFNDEIIVIVVPQGEEHDDSPEPLISTTALFSIVIAIRGSSDEKLAEMGKLKADIAVALTADGSERRGGDAVTTRIMASRTFDRPRAQTTLEAQVDVAVDYRTIFGDPTTAY